MLETKEIEIAIKNCLVQLGTDSNITIATLPNKANEFYEKIGSKKTINIIVPIVTGEKPNPTQLLRYEVLIHIILQDRVDDTIPSIDYTKNEIIRLIMENFKNYVCSNSYWFSSYRLVPAKNGYWSAELTFIIEKYMVQGS